MFKKIYTTVRFYFRRPHKVFPTLSPDTCPYLRARLTNEGATTKLATAEIRDCEHVTPPLITSGLLRDAEIDVDSGETLWYADFTASDDQGISDILIQYEHEISGKTLRLRAYGTEGAGTQTISGSNGIDTYQQSGNYIFRTAIITDVAGNKTEYASASDIGIQNMIYIVNNPKILPVIPATPAVPASPSSKESPVLGIQPQETVTTAELTTPLTLGNLQVTQAVVGTPQNDVITGSDAGEALAGGKGKDQMTGGGGPDAFLFETPEEFGKKSLDIVTDFNPGEGDKVVISKDAFDGVKKIRLDVASGKKDVKNSASSNKTFIYDEKSGVLYFNENGKKDGFGNGGEFVKLLGAPDIENRDFVII